MSLPNLISLARLLSVPLAVWLVVYGWMEAAFWLFVAAGVSDAADGFIAKRFGQKTVLGSYLDPLADKALLVSIFIVLGAQQYLPSWIVILVVFRDLLIVGGALLMHIFLSAHPPITPLRISKLNTAAQIVLAGTTLALAGFELNWPWVKTSLILFVAFTTLASGGAYLLGWSRSWRQIEDAN